MGVIEPLPLDRTTALAGAGDFSPSAGKTTPWTKDAPATKYGIMVFSTVSITLPAVSSSNREEAVLSTVSTIVAAKSSMEEGILLMRLQTNDNFSESFCFMHAWTFAKTVPFLYCTVGIILKILITSSTVQFPTTPTELTSPDKSAKRSVSMS